MRMKDFSINRLFILYMLMGALFVAGGVMAFDEGDIGVGIGLCIIGAGFVLVPSILMPFEYVFESDGITLCYFFLPNERYFWRNIRSICTSDDRWGCRHGFGIILDLIFSRTYEIGGNVEGTRRFYMDGVVRRTHRTKRLLKKYWKKEIVDGYKVEPKAKPERHHRKRKTRGKR